MEEDEANQLIWTSDGLRRRRRADIAEPFITYSCELCGRRPEMSPRDHYGLHLENARAFLEMASARGDRQGVARAQGWIETCRRILPDLREPAVREEAPVTPPPGDEDIDH